MSRICIIGCGGVGKAHALSAAKYLQDQVGTHTIILIDSNKEAFEMYYTNTWKNSWGPISDEVHIDRQKIRTEFSPAGGFIPQADLYIIATPNKFHYDYLDLLRHQKVICEKPIVEYGQFVPSPWSDLYLGIEWVYHPALADLYCIKEISFVHGWAPVQATVENRWQDYDLGSHLLGVVSFVNEDVGQPTKIKHEKMVTTWEGGCVKYSCGYNPEFTSDIIIINRHLMLDWIPFEENDLFYRQIDHVLRNKGNYFSPCDIVKHDSYLHMIRSSKE